MSVNHTLCDVLVGHEKLWTSWTSACMCVWYACHSSLVLYFPAVPANISELKNLEVLNMFNNQIEELPTQISSLQKLKHLNLGYVSLTVCVHTQTKTHTLF